MRYSFKYDAFGRRIEKRRMNSSIKFVWDDNVLLHEVLRKNTKDSEDKITTWIFEGFLPTAKLVNGKAYSIISDHLGTPIMALDSEGNEVWTRLLDIYGRVKYEFKSSSLGDEVFSFVPFLYQGQYYDFETNLAYNRYRYYSPESGMYISQDPIKLLGSTPNLYMYVKDPNITIDIWGLDSRKLDKALGGVKGDRMAAHHLIPETVYNKYSAFFNAIGVERDDAKNGLLMPSSAKKAAELGDPKMIVHCGGHPDYIKEVEAKVDKIEKKFEGKDLTDEEIKNKAIKEIRDLQEELRKDIVNKKKGVKSTNCGGSNTLA